MSFVSFFKQIQSPGEITLFGETKGKKIGNTTLQKDSPASKLPSDLFKIITSFLDCVTFERFKGVCKDWYRLASHLFIPSAIHNLAPARGSQPVMVALFIERAKLWLAQFKNAPLKLEKAQNFCAQALALNLNLSGGDQENYQTALEKNKNALSKNLTALQGAIEAINNKLTTITCPKLESLLKQKQPIKKEELNYGFAFEDSCAQLEIYEKSFHSSVESAVLIHLRYALKNPESLEENLTKIARHFGSKTTDKAFSKLDPDEQERVAPTLKVVSERLEFVGFTPKAIDSALEGFDLMFSFE